MIAEAEPAAPAGSHSPETVRTVIGDDPRARRPGGHPRRIGDINGLNRQITQVGLLTSLGRSRRKI
jgi:hypothetical protein